MKVKIKTYCLETCDQNCDKMLEPHCLNLKRLFNNLCLLDCAVNREKIEKGKIFKGSCDEAEENEKNNKKKENCTKTCSFDKNEDAPVCGSDGVMYPNECYFELAVCKDPSIKVLGDGECWDHKDTEDNKADEKAGDKDGHDAPPICGIVCNKMYHPVCGSDGVTYSNKCMLDLTACENKESIEKVYDGKCAGELMHNGMCTRMQLS